MPDELIQQLSLLIAEDLKAAPFAAPIEQLVERLQGDQRIEQMLQFNTGNAIGFQTFVDKGGTAKVGIHLPENFDREKLLDVLKEFWKSLQPREIPNNVPRSGVTKFIGRESELETLHTQLQEGSLVSISAVKGMGGIGKTELAIQYTQRYTSAYTGGIAWLLAREFNIGTQIVGYAQAQLGLKIPEGMKLADQVAFCWRFWREGDVLLILDDVVNYVRDVEPYLPPHALSRFKILMTTRLTIEPPVKSISLDVLNSEQALELLIVLIEKNRVYSELEIARTLCKWLGYLPLGIELVGRYLRRRSDLSISTLLFLLQEEAKTRKAIKSDALQRDDVKGTSTARRGVEAAFNLSWEELNGGSRHLGKLLSLFAPAPIPWNLVESVERDYCSNSEFNLDFNENNFKEYRQNLLDLHLLQLSDNQASIYRLHSLIREFFRSKLEGEDDIES
jgi:hypothetical protein